MSDHYDDYYDSPQPKKTDMQVLKEALKTARREIFKLVKRLRSDKTKEVNTGKKEFGEISSYLAESIGAITENYTELDRRVNGEKPAKKEPPIDVAPVPVTQYRLLERGELCKEGDEVSVGSEAFRKAEKHHIGRVLMNPNVRIRRVVPITPSLIPASPEALPRFKALELD
jgi:hypothetical protein